MTSIVCKSSFLLANSGMTLGREGGLEVGRLEFSWRKAAAGEGDWGQTAVVGNAKTERLERATDSGFRCILGSP